MTRSIETLAEIAMAVFKEAGGGKKRKIVRGKSAFRQSIHTVDQWKVDMSVWTAVAEAVRDAVKDDIGREAAGYAINVNDPDSLIKALHLTYPEFKQRIANELINRLDLKQLHKD